MTRVMATSPHVRSFGDESSTPSKNCQGQSSNFEVTNRAHEINGCRPKNVTMARSVSLSLSARHVSGVPDPCCRPPGVRGESREALYRRMERAGVVLERRLKI